MHTLAIYNAKGGVGKTTTACSLAAGLARRGLRVLAVDLDPQGHLSHWLDADTQRPTLYSAIAGAAALGACVQATRSGVDLIAANGELVGAEAVLRSRIGGDRWLGAQLERLADRWDWCILDCPPGLGVLTVSALAAAAHVLAPVAPAVLDLIGTQRLLETIEEARENLNPRLSLLGVLATRVDVRLAMTRELLEQLREALGDRMFETTIASNVRLGEAPDHRVPIYDYDPKSRGAADYEALTAEVLERAEA